MKTNLHQNDKTCMHQFFQEVSEWSALEAKDVRRLEKVVACCQLEVGDVLFEEGDPCLGVHFVKSGLIGLRKSALDGYSTLLRIVRPGDSLGIRSLIAEESHRATAKVLKRSLVCFIDAANIRSVIQQNLTLGNNLLKHTAVELGEADERYHEMATRNLRSRLAHLLMLLNDGDARIGKSGSLKFELPVSRTDMAAMLGVRRESVSRTIHEFEQEGLAHFTDRNVEIPDQKSLQAEFRP